MNLRVDEPLNDGHLCLFELLVGVTSSSVGNVNRVTELDVIREGDVRNLDVGSVPTTEELDTTIGGDSGDLWRKSLTHFEGSSEDWRDVEGVKGREVLIRLEGKW